MERGRQSFLLWDVNKQWPGGIEEILVENGLSQMTSEGSSSPEMHSTVLGREERSGGGLAGQNSRAAELGWVSEGLDQNQPVFLVP